MKGRAALTSSRAERDGGVAVYSDSRHCQASTAATTVAQAASAVVTPLLLKVIPTGARAAAAAPIAQ